MARIIVLTIVLSNLLFQGFVSAQIMPGGVKLTLQQPLVAPSRDILATQVTITLPPGDSGAPPHIHSGPTVGYVVEGEFLFQVSGKPQQIIPAGEAFYELTGDVHVWAGNASNSTRCMIVATVYGDPDKPVNTYLTDYKRESREEALILARAQKS